MLLDQLISIIIMLLSNVVSLFPLADTRIVGYITTFSSTLNGYLVTASYFFPVNTMLTLLSIMLVIEGTILAFKTVRWIASNVTLGFLK